MPITSKLHSRLKMYNEAGLFEKTHVGIQCCFFGHICKFPWFQTGHSAFLYIKDYQRKAEYEKRQPEFN